MRQENSGIRDVTAEEYDVVVVGSGGGGGMAAYRLTSLGVRVCLVEQGPNQTPDQIAMLQRDSDAPLRAIGTPDKNWGYFDNGECGTWFDDQPYVQGEGTAFSWYRAQVLGGRTNHYARHSPRIGPYDMIQGDLDGLSPNWPMSFEEMVPYYNATEAVVGISGENTGMYNHPGTPDAILQPPIAPRAYELLIMAAARNIGVPAFQRHNAILTRNLGERMACYYASPCMRGCSIGAAFSSSTSLIPLANKTGKLTIVTRAKVCTVETGADGTATGVTFVDTQTGKEGAIRARAVVLAASACATAQILLTSGRNGSKDGLANSSGQVGRNLTDTPGLRVTGHFPDLEHRPRYDEFGANMDHVYMPWWGYEAQKAGRMDFPRGYHIEVGQGMREAPAMWNADFYGKRNGFNGYGERLREEMRKYWGSFVYLDGRGEQVASDDCYCELDDTTKNKWGYPVLKFNWRWSDYEYNQIRHMQESFTAIIERAGGTVVSGLGDPEDVMSPGGGMVHEVGTTRMGNDPATNVCNSYGQTWDVPNLYVMDGGVLPTNPHKNPTLHIMALAYRNSEDLARRLQQREI